MNGTQKIALDLLKRALRDTPEAPDSGFASADWEKVFTFVKQHAVVPLAWHTIKKTPFYARAVPEDVKARMKAIVMRRVFRNECLMAFQGEVLRLFAENGVRCAVLKGSSAAVCFPDPGLRVLGDIDLLIAPSSVGAAGALLRQAGYEEAESEHHFHVAYHKLGITVELHFALSKMQDQRQAGRVDALMEGALDDIAWRSMPPYHFPVLSPARQAVSLLLHMKCHWLAGGIGLRQLIDWHAFVVSNGELALLDMMPELSRCGLSRFAMVFTEACAAYLGLEGHAWRLAIPGRLGADMMADILRSGNFGSRLAESGASQTLYSGRREKSEEPFLRGALKGLNRNIQTRYPVCAKVPVFLVFFWVFLPLRYWVRSLLGLREKQSSLRTVRIAAARKKLSQALREPL